MADTQTTTGTTDTTGGTTTKLDDKTSTTQTGDTTTKTGGTTGDTTSTTGTGDTKKTIAQGAEGDTTKTTQPTFGDNWRKDLAGEDDKALKRLERFGSPKDIVTSYLELEKKLSEGQKKPALPANATAEQLASYRQEIGVPDSPDKYDTKLSDGLVIGEAAKPMMDAYLKYAHDHNIPADMVKTNLEWYAQLEQQREQQQQEDDRDFQISQEDVMRKEWGGDFKANINLITGLLETVPSEIADSLMLGRTSDGRIIGDDPRMLKLLSNWAREINPIQTVVPNTGTNAPEAIKDEISKLVKMSGDKKSEYWSKDKGPAMQQRLRDLNEAQTRITDRGKKTA